MSTQSTLSKFTLKAFYDDTAIENWTCARIMEYYRSKSKQKNRKKVLDRIKKDIEEVEESDSFDIRKKRKAREILDNWKVCLLMRLNPTTLNCLFRCLNELRT